MNLKVLYLDDEPVLCEIFADYFATAQISIVTFTEPAGAVLYSLTNPLDTIFIDYRLPRITGDEVAKQMPPLVAKYLVTGELQPRLNYEFAGIIKKPIDVAGIQKILSEELIKKSDNAKKLA